MKKKTKKIIVGTVMLMAAAGSGIFAYLYQNGLPGRYANTKAMEEQIKVACVGDSITYGHGVSNWKENNYPAVLQKLLGDRYHVANFGSTGACVNPNGDQPYISRKVYQESLDYDADILVFMLGTNDSKQENWKGKEAFLQDYMKLLGTYLDGEHSPKIYIGVCSEAYFTKPSETGVAGFDIQPSIVDEIAEELKRISLNSHICCSVIDIHTLTEAHPEWFKTDGIHPNKDGAKAIAEMVFGIIKN